MIGNPLEYFQTVEVIKKCKDFLGKVTGLELEVVYVDRKDSPLPVSMENNSEADSGRKSQSTDSAPIHPDLLDDILASKKPRFFYCPRGRMKVAVPLVLNGEVAGLFIAGENGSSKLDPAKRDALSTFLSEIGNYVLESESAFLQDFKGNSNTHKQELLGRILKYVKNNAHNNKLSLQQVARDNGISYYYLSHLFKDELKTTFVEYRTRVRMYLAAKLMMDRRLTIDQISQACGFEDSSYFCKSFKKIYQCTPVAFRSRFIVGKKPRKIDALIRKRTAMMSGPALPMGRMARLAGRAFAAV